MPGTAAMGDEAVVEEVVGLGGGVWVEGFGWGC